MNRIDAVEVIAVGLVLVMLCAASTLPLMVVAIILNGGG